MESWHVPTLDAVQPEVLETLDGARAIAVRLEPGGEMGEHRTRERAWVTVVEGSATFVANGAAVEGRPGTVVTFAPGETHSVRTTDGVAFLLLLAPWPGDGHVVDDGNDTGAPSGRDER